MNDTLAYLLARGFDGSTRDGKYCHVKCSQCAAAVISGVAAHERGCPNMTRECEECDARIPARHRYCDECAQNQGDLSL